MMWLTVSRAIKDMVFEAGQAGRIAPGKLNCREEMKMTYKTLSKGGGKLAERHSGGTAALGRVSGGGRCGRVGGI